MRIGISGGTFDPIHNAHIACAYYAMEKFMLDKVLFIPVGNPPHKDISTVTPAKHRLAMAEAALYKHEKFEVLDIEVKREGATYTVDTLNELKLNFDKKTVFYYIIGADVVYDLEKWKDFKKAAVLCKFIAFIRPGYDLKSFEKQIKYIEEKYFTKIHSVNMPLSGISSTMIRETSKDRSLLKKYVPNKVYDYIIKNKLYV